MLIRRKVRSTKRCLASSFGKHTTIIYDRKIRNVSLGVACKKCLYYSFNLKVIIATSRNLIKSAKSIFNVDDAWLFK